MVAANILFAVDFIVNAKALLILAGQQTHLRGVCRARDGQIVALVQLLDFIELVAELLNNRWMNFPEIFDLEWIF